MSPPEYQVQSITPVREDSDGVTACFALCVSGCVFRGVCFALCVSRCVFRVAVRFVNFVC